MIRNLSSSYRRLPGPTGGVVDYLRHALDVLLAWQERATERRYLASLGESQLRDLGLSRADVAQEAAKPFWRQ